MPLKLHNTLTRQLEEFSPIEPDHVKIYSCGPTVYNYAHIGNFRAYVFVDILRRYFMQEKYQIKHVMNLTDIDDKTIKGSQEQNIPLTEYTEKYAKIFFEHSQELKITKPTTITKATEYIPEMIAIIQDLIDKEIAYQGKDGSVYFSIVKFPEYGQLSKLDKSGIKIGFRINHQEYDKDQAADFVLWKARSEEDGPNFWPSPFGEGRPGWHIECSAMSIKHLGNHFDIHTGAVDNIFPHHENEIAQSQCHTGEKFVNYWLHNEHLLVNGQKMSKSANNFYNLEDIKNEKYSARDLRYLYLTSHYRSKLNFTWDSLQACHNVVKNIDNFFVRLSHVDHEVANIQANSYDSLFNSTRDQFHEAIEDDLNTPKALAVIHNLIKKINILLDQDKIGKRACERTQTMLIEFDDILAVLIGDNNNDIPTEIIDLAEKRIEARKKKKYSEADKYREEIEKMGYNIEDTDNKYLITKK